MVRLGQPVEIPPDPILVRVVQGAHRLRCQAGARQGRGAGGHHGIDAAKRPEQAVQQGAPQAGGSKCD
jgi:hypothetical protein